MHTDVISVILGEVEFIRKFGSIPFFCSALVALIVAVIRKKGGSMPMFKKAAPPFPFADCLTAHIVLGCIRSR